MATLLLVASRVVPPFAKRRSWYVPDVSVEDVAMATFPLAVPVVFWRTW
jgi:hypothetical protein